MFDQRVSFYGHSSVVVCRPSGLSLLVAHGGFGETGGRHSRLNNVFVYTVDEQGETLATSPGWSLVIYHEKTTPYFHGPFLITSNTTRFLNFLLFLNVLKFIFHSYFNPMSQFSITYCLPELIQTAASCVRLDDCVCLAVMTLTRTSF